MDKRVSGPQQSMIMMLVQEICRMVKTDTKYANIKLDR